jgi:hypothetical protein
MKNSACKIVQKKQIAATTHKQQWFDSTGQCTLKFIFVSELYQSVSLYIHAECMPLF